MLGIWYMTQMHRQCGLRELFDVKKGKGSESSEEWETMMKKKK